jgi:NADPH:quinone reductase-like Zn-dependent oxidoreductase
MKAWYIRTEGERMVLEPRDVPVPQPKAGEVLLKVHATAMNRGELIAGHGLHTGSDAKPAGTEASGIVDAVGEGVTNVRKGDRIMGRVRGGFAEYAVLDAHQAMPMPERLSWEQAASVPLVYCTAYDLLWTYGKLQPGETLLVTGVSSGVGVACLAGANVIGAKTIGTSGSKDKLAKLEALGLDVGINTRTDFAAQVKAATNDKGANLAVNTVGGSVFPEIIKSLAYLGRVGIVGYVDGVTESRIDLDAVHARRLQVYGVSNKFATAELRAMTARGFVRDFLPAFADGRVAPVIDSVFDFADLPKAQQRMESNAALGKIAVRVA